MSTEPVPFRLCRRPEEVELITRSLEEAGIPHRVSSTAAQFDITALGSERDNQVAILVRPEQLSDATRVVAAAEEEAFEGVPEDHFFRDYSDPELGQVLVTDFEWNAYDVACARALLRERGALPAEEAITEAREKYLAVLREGKQSSRLLLILGFLIAIFGGFPMVVIPIGVASAWMGWSFMTMKQTDPLGATYHTYNEQSRKEGRILFFFSVLSIAIWAVIFFLGILDVLAL